MAEPSQDAPMHRPPQSRRIALPLLTALLLPFVVGFDMPDSTGTYLKVAAGRGAYHLSGCHRSYDSELVEGNVAMRATFNTEDDGVTFWSRIQPKRTTFGVSTNYTHERLTLVSTDDADSIGKVYRDHGLMGGLEAGFDWTYMGLKVGVIGYTALQKVPYAAREGGLPILALRLGPEWLYATAEVANAAPLYTGGGLMQMGAGGRLASTRLWVGLGAGPFHETMVTGKATQKAGPVTVFAAGMLGIGNPPGDGISRENALSIGVETRIPGIQ